MANIAEDAAQELPLNDERLPETKKHGRNTSSALTSVRRQLAIVDKKMAELTAERLGLVTAIEALDK